MPNAGRAIVSFRIPEDQKTAEGRNRKHRIISFLNCGMIRIQILQARHQTKNPIAEIQAAEIQYDSQDNLTIGNSIVTKKLIRG